MKRDFESGSDILQRVEAGLALTVFEHRYKACVNRDPFGELPLRYVGESPRNSDCFRVVHCNPKFLDVSFPGTRALDSCTTD